MKFFKHLKPKSQVSRSFKPKCDHTDCSSESRGFMECAPLKDGHFTQFQLMKCGRCHKIFGFPDDNLKIAIENGTEETLEELKKAGVEIPEKNENESINPSSRRNEYENM